ncbi:MAG: tRNA pseudouridine(55) synthase TruB, partial [Firmicutes bacterium]|nr:tRNA pseudouridine(55) synthase TruB [Bacillota bacterium]
MDGLIVVDKPQGFTSHDVVARVRRITDERSCGHTGTLDPPATGVLVLCLGRATRLARFMVDLPKEYIAEIVFGVSTDTADSTGTPTRETSNFEIEKAAVFDAMSQFRGEIQQVPPMMSAVHHKGRRLYELAREGIEVERQARTVEIYEIRPVDAESWPDPVVFGSRGRIQVRCSKGTYVRTLCVDLCRALRVEG